MKERLEEIALLQDGWLSGEGLAPRRVDLEWFGQAWGSHCAQWLSPYIYPTLEGGLLLEWESPLDEPWLEVYLSAHKAVLTTNEEEHTLNLDVTEDWILLGSLLAVCSR